MGVRFHVRVRSLAAFASRDTASPQTNSLGMVADTHQVHNHPCSGVYTASTTSRAAPIRKMPAARLTCTQAGSGVFPRSASCRSEIAFMPFGSVTQA